MHKTINTIPFENKIQWCSLKGHLSDHKIRFVNFDIEVANINFKLKNQLEYESGADPERVV